MNTTSTDREKAAVPRAVMRHPLPALLARYRDILTVSWQQRHALAGPARLADEAAFLPAALSLQATPPHPAPRRALWAIMALFASALAWACVGELDIVAVAPGRVVVSEGTKVIQPLEISLVKAIHVQDGDKVQAGQLLIELDPTMARADSRGVEQQRAAAMSDSWRAQALLAAIQGRQAPQLPGEAAQADASMKALAQAQLDAEWLDLQAQRSKLEADIATRQAELQTVQEQVGKLEATLPLAQKREADFDALARQGFVSQHAGEDRRRLRIEMERDLSTYRARRVETLAEIAEAVQARKAWQAETLRTLQERQAKADLLQRQLQEEGVKSGQRERLANLTAPVSGTVQQLAVHTAGGVVTPAQVLMVIVPQQAEVTAEVTLENKDVGFVNVGQEAEIKLETFPYTRYGTVPAVVSRITQDAVVQRPEPEGAAMSESGKRKASPGGAVFPATLTMRREAIAVDGRSIRLAPGMNLTAEIKTGKRSVIDYLLSPVQSHVRESLRER